ncbi:DoxX family membrane protein [Microlunatus panaciterrae]|uniref:Thiosulfate dehydrogenase [quinone] large subunit n=1 Tax=Microlunatus panaciterrae TaxID=400768 RepID=A0ABS2RRR1_9ACTN|nr:hypothetical protein [Microlunatus panaciterrae]MBM7800629.1 thiosulfate dehydrogenase [quinone] large subunit [Microlunatus panaciterrae]
MSSFARKALAVLRLAFGFMFLWAFVDKLFGFGFATPAAKAWIRGGDPTYGFLANSPAGPFKGFYNSLAGDFWVTPLFMLALLAIGVSLILGIGLRITAVAGGLLYLMMWSVALPPVTNPFLDDHLTGLITLAVLAATFAGDTWGLGRIWSQLDIVDKHPVLR